MMLLLMMMTNQKSSAQLSSAQLSAMLDQSNFRFRVGVTSFLRFFFGHPENIATNHMLSKTRFFGLHFYADTSMGLTSTTVDGGASL